MGLQEWEGTVRKRVPFTDDNPFVLIIAIAGVAVLVISLMFRGRGHPSNRSLFRAVLEDGALTCRPGTWSNLKTRGFVRNSLIR